MKIRAKLQLTAITNHQYGNKTLKFDTRYDESIPEDQRFMTATPYGSFEMNVSNPVAIEYFKDIGDDFYIDFEKIIK